MPFFRLRRVKAIQVGYTQVALYEAATWCGGALWISTGHGPGKSPDSVSVPSPEGVNIKQFAKPSDWIVRRGEYFAVMSNKEFQAMYEEIEEEYPHDPG